jgi:hypothetical protein
MRFYLVPKWLDPFWVLAGTVISYFLMLFFFSFKEDLKSKHAVKAALVVAISEGIFWVPVIASFWIPLKKINIAHPLMYHTMVWFVIPLILQTRAQIKFPKIAAYPIAATVVSAFFLIIVLFVVEVGQRTFSMWYFETMRWGYVHINASLALSTLNPIWLRRIFNQV